jgi:hypothetical protein
MEHSIAPDSAAFRRCCAAGGCACRIPRRLGDYLLKASQGEAAAGCSLRSPSQRRHTLRDVGAERAWRASLASLRISPAASGAASAPTSSESADMARRQCPGLIAPFRLEGGRPRILILGGGYAGLTATVAACPPQARRRGRSRSTSTLIGRSESACTNSQSAEQRDRSISRILRHPTARASSGRASRRFPLRAGLPGWRRGGGCDLAALRPLHPGARSCVDGRAVKAG